MKERFGRSACLNPLRIKDRGLRAFGVATNKLGYERAAVLALAVTAVLSGICRPRGREMRKLKLEAERAIPNCFAGVPGAVSCEGEERRARRPVKKWHTKRAHQKKRPSQQRVQPTVPTAACKRRPRPPFHALSDNVQAKAMPKVPGFVETARAMPSMMPEIALAAASSKAAPPAAIAKAMPQAKQEVEIKEEVEVKTEPTESSDSEVEGEEKQQFVAAPSIPKGPDFLRLAQLNRDWDPASPKFDRATWASCIKRVDCELLRWTHATISCTFRNGKHKGQPVETLTNKLLSGEASVEDVPALVGVQDEHGHVWVVSGNRRLYALKAFADKIREERGVHGVEVNALLVSLSDMNLFPQSLFARCVEAFSGDGGRPSLRTAVPQPQPQPLPASAPRGTIFRSWLTRSLQGSWVDQRNVVYLVTEQQRDSGLLEVVKNNKGDLRTHTLEWDGQTFAWRSHSCTYLAIVANNGTIKWRRDRDGQISFTWQRLSKEWKQQPLVVFQDGRWTAPDKLRLGERNSAESSPNLLGLFGRNVSAIVPDGLRLLFWIFVRGFGQKQPLLMALKRRWTPRWERQQGKRHKNGLVSS